MNLRKIRENANKTQSEVATYLGVSRQCYNNYELGNRQLNPDMLNKLADYFNVSTDYLLGREHRLSESEPAIDDDDIIKIERARKKMSYDEWERFMGMAIGGFKKYFDEDFIDEDTDE